MTIRSESKEPVIAKMHELKGGLDDTITALQHAIIVLEEICAMTVDSPAETTHAKTNIPLTFYENEHVIVWRTECKRFSSSVFLFVRQLWYAPNHTISKKEVRQHTLCNDSATPESLRTLVKNARRALEVARFPYEIVTLLKDGYMLKVRSQS